MITIIYFYIAKNILYELIMGKNSPTGTRTRVFRVRAEHPNQLDYGGLICCARWSGQLPNVIKKLIKKGAPGVEPGTC